MAQILYVKNVMPSKAWGKESLDEIRKITAHELLQEFINPVNGNLCDPGLINSSVPF